MATRKLMDISGIPFVVEVREDGLYAVGIKIRTRMVKFEGSGLPVDIENRILGVEGNEKIDGIVEMEEFLEEMPEGSKLKDHLQGDEDVEDLNQEINDIFFPDGEPE